MKRAVVFLLFFLFCPSSLPAQSPKHLLLGLASISGGIDVLYVTKKTGAFKRNGLEVDFILFQEGSQALQVLLAGDVKMISGGGTAAQRARMKGAGNVLVATYTPTMPFSLYVNNKIQDGKQLKGGKIAISRFGSSSDFAARYILTRLGVEPAKEVTLMQIGNQRERLSALLSGAVDGAVIDAPNTLLARQQGFRQLADASVLGSKNALIGHVADWPIGLYHKAHYHGGGAVIVILKSQGYTLLWPKEIGTRPYATGRSEEVVELRWREGSVLSPPGGWFHQHFNIGKEAARQLALRYGSRLFPIGLHQAAKKKTDGVYISVKKGGTMIEYEDEDAEIRRRYEAKLKRLGTPLRMRA